MVGAIFCRYAAREQLQVSPHAEGCAQWLGRAELQTLAALRCPERRMSWLSGRVLAKQVLMEAVARGRLAVQMPKPTEIEIKSVDGGGRSTRPQVVIGNESLTCSLSVSHTSRGTLVAVSCRAGVSVGVDLVQPIGLNRRFVELWFTPAEQRCFGLTSHLPRASAVWACKEAVYKACNRGQGFAPRRIEIQRSRTGTLTSQLLGCQSTPESVLQNWQVDGQMAAIAIVPHSNAGISS